MVVLVFPEGLDALLEKMESGGNGELRRRWHVVVATPKLLNGRHVPKAHNLLLKVVVHLLHLLVLLFVSPELPARTHTKSRRIRSRLNKK